MKIGRFTKDYGFMVDKRGMKKRAQIIVKPNIQLKLIGIIVVTSLIPIIALYVGLYIYSEALLEKIPATEEALVQIVETIQRVNIITLSGFIFAVIVLIVVQTFFLHRVIGPLYRLEQELEEIHLSKNYNHQITIRSSDFLHPLVAKINRLIKEASSHK